MTIKPYAHGTGDFWQLMGPMFASPLVKRELGIAMSSDESYQWFVGIKGTALTGFCAVTTEKAGSRLRHVYVLPEHRNQGYGSQLIESAVVQSQKPITLWSKAKDTELYEQFGFGATGKSRGQYVEMSHE